MVPFSITIESFTIRGQMVTLGSNGLYLAQTKTLGIKMRGTRVASDDSVLGASKKWSGY